MAYANVNKIVIILTTLRLRDCLSRCNALKSRVCPLITPVAETVEHARMQGCMLRQRASGSSNCHYLEEAKFLTHAAATGLNVAGSLGQLKLG